MRRVYEHKHNLLPGFTGRYNINELVYFEETSDVQTGLAREKEIKGWRRSKKSHLIESLNPKWVDLSAGWFEDEIPRFAMTPRMKRDRSGFRSSPVVVVMRRVAGRGLYGSSGRH